MSPSAGRSNSPAAPSRSLETCFGVAGKIYDDYGHTEFGAAEIAGTANLSATSGQGKSLISDLKQYGLTEKKSPGRFAITQEFKDAAALTPGTIEFKVAALQFTRKPKVFLSVLADAKGKLPEETALANNLRSTYQFNQAKAKTTAKALSDSLEWAGALDGNRNIIEPRLGKVDSKQDSTVDVRQDVQTQEDAGADGAPSKPGRLSMDIPLADGRTAHVSYPHDLTVEEAGKIGKVLAAVSG